MPGEEGGIGGPQGDGGGGGKREWQTRNRYAPKKLTPKVVDKKKGIKHVDVHRSEEEQMFKMLVKVMVGLSVGLFLVFVYSFMKPNSLKTPDSYDGYDGSAI